MISRRAVFRIHSWCGAIASTFILVQAITGCTLAYRDRLAQIIDPTGMVRQSASGEVSLQTVLRSLRAANPGYEANRIMFPAAGNGTYFVYLADKTDNLRYASVDPGDARILRQGSVWSFPAEVALNIHETLFIGAAGAIFVFLLGTVVLTMIATGLIFWWPRPGRWRRGLNIDFALSPRLVLRQAHRSLAVIVCALIGTSALTGVVLAVSLLVDGRPTFAGGNMDQAPRAEIGIDQGVALARTRFPGRDIRDLRMPASDQLNVYFWAPERNPTAVHLVGIDLATGRIAGQMLARDDPGLWVIPYPVHTGKSFGWIGRILMFSGGVGMAVLSVSGFVMWRQAPRRA